MKHDAGAQQNPMEVGSLGTYDSYVHTVDIGNVGVSRRGACERNQLLVVSSASFLAMGREDVVTQGEPKT